MTTEERIIQLENKVKDLEQKSIRYKMDLLETENLKNSIFEGFFQPFNDTHYSDEETRRLSIGTFCSVSYLRMAYLKMKWRNKVIYIPYFID